MTKGSRSRGVRLELSPVVGMAALSPLRFRMRGGIESPGLGQGAGAGSFETFDIGSEVIRIEIQTFRRLRRRLGWQASSYWGNA